MEKIYMHDDNNKKKTTRKKKKQTIFGSVGIAIVAVLALIVVAFNNISFAIPEEGSHLGDSFTSKEIVAADGVKGNISGFNVPMIYTAAGDQVFCIERDIYYLGGLEYKKDVAINDAGLIYLLASVYPNPEFAPGVPDDARTWLSQTAIWIYVAENGYANNTAMTADVIASIKAEKSLYTDASFAAGQANGTSTNLLELTDDDTKAGIGTLYQKYKVDDILAQANLLKDLPANKLDVTRASNKITLTSDGKYYQTDYVSVVGSVSSEKIGSFNGYQLTLKNAPEGSIVINDKGEEIKDTSNMLPGTKFAVKVPVANLKEENKNMEISVLGSFNSYIAHRYIYTGSQTVTSVKQINNNLSVPLNIQMNYTPTVPDTALDNTNTLFFIGIILLLSGLGFFYTSAKKS